MRLTRPVPRDERGMSMVEMVVVVGLLAIVGLVVLRSVDSGLDAQRHVQTRDFGRRNLQVVFERISREARVADPLLTATASSLGVNIYRDGKCYRMTWTAAGTTLSLRTLVYNNPASCTASVLPSASSDSGSRVILKGLANTTLFRYFEQDGTELVAPTSTQISSIDRVTITARINLTEGHAPVTATTSVDLRNVEV